MWDAQTQKYYEVNGHISVQYEVYCKVSGFLLVMNYDFLGIMHRPLIIWNDLKYISCVFHCYRM